MSAEAYPAAATSVENLLAVLADGAGRSDESDDLADDVVTQLDHALQCAARLAAAHPDDLELQAAGLLHDIGHTLVPADSEGHGRHGRRFVEPLLGPRVGALVELHVPAKRWLVTVDPDYRGRLSAGSTASLIGQGGELDLEERAAFEASPYHADAVRLRRADEEAKRPGLVVAPLERWRPLLDVLVSRP